ncbi:MAG: type II toxin-antitoxin system PemK/MazF family toxin [Anaerolineae bacterium]|nr:type II toxin-antitoxin system PemK/MazF family toxin [Anaerolineae bacterium]
MTTRIQSSAASRGEIWFVNFDPSKGAEIQKTRPAVVINVRGIGRLPLHIVVPITDWKPDYALFPWFVHLTPDADNGLHKESGVDTFQVKSISTDRFVRRLGSVTDEQIRQIAGAIALCIGYP